MRRRRQARTVTFGDGPLGLSLEQEYGACLVSPAKCLSVFTGNWGRTSPRLPPCLRSWLWLYVCMWRACAIFSGYEG